MANGANWLLREEQGAFPLQGVAYDRARGGAPFLPRWPLVIVAMSVYCQRAAPRMIAGSWWFRRHYGAFLSNSTRHTHGFALHWSSGFLAYIVSQSSRKGLT